jgi:hypothetical protein
MNMVLLTTNMGMCSGCKQHCVRNDMFSGHAKIKKSCCLGHFDYHYMYLFSENFDMLVEHISNCGPGENLGY